MISAKCLLSLSYLTSPQNFQSCENGGPNLNTTAMCLIKARMKERKKRGREGREGKRGYAIRRVREKEKEERKEKKDSETKKI